MHTRPTKPVFKRLVSLTKASGRREQGACLVPGVKCIEEARRAGRSIDALLIRPESEEIAITVLGESLFSQLDFQGLVYTLKEQEMLRLAGQTSPEGLLAVVAIQKENLEPQAPHLVLDQINDPGNMGSILRTALWFGFKRVSLLGACADPWSTKSLRSAMGAQLHLESVQSVRDEDLILWKEKGARFLGLDSNTGDPLEKHNFDEHDILVMGSESHGLTLPENLLSKTLHIKGGGDAESLNVGHAFAICAWARSLEQ
jgi:RNA methyltransferase, TrmH family